MHNPLESQRELIDQLYRIMKGSCPDHASSAICRFEYRHGSDDGSFSVEEAFGYVIDGAPVSALLKGDLATPVHHIIPELHALMKAHTGGDWAECTVKINEDGTVAASFDYSGQTQD
ncbi:hypothetical protein [Sphingomonas pituitosa]|uniref:hypothetical protein n=1 Tax=Sphingomonas pituitosa TaxID=99597 RepID=UPI0012EEC1DA|nr:hypothetical protein [Sphingomonas pituitosa]